MRRVLVVIALVCLFAPAHALASRAGGQKLIADCAKHGQVTGKYTQSDYQYALAHLPSDLDEYTNCREAIRQAQQGAGGPLAPTPAEQSLIGNARSHGGGAVNIGGGAPISPGGPGVSASRLTRELPDPLLLVLVLMSIAALGATSAAVRSRVLARRHA